MECPIRSRETAEVLLAYGTRRLDAAAAALLEEHLAVCPECRAFAGKQRVVWSALDDWEAMPVSPDFDRALYARIEERERSGWWRRVWTGGPALSWRPAVSLAAASVVLMAVLLLRHPAVPVVPAADRAEGVDIEQVESTLDDLDMLRQLYPSPRAEAAASKSL